jgi:hypothetical protein
MEVLIETQGFYVQCRMGIRILGFIYQDLLEG